MAAKSKGNVLTLDDATYSYYAITKPRPYTLVVFLTAAHAKFKCVVCKTLDREFHTLADAYSTSIKASGEQPNIFFVRIDYESAPQTFKKYDVMTVPLVYFINPTTVGTDGGGDGGEYSVSARDKYPSPVPAEVDAEALSNFVRDRVGITITIKRSMIWAYFVLIVVFIVIALLVQPAINALPFWLQIVQSKVLWQVVSAAIYTCAISGLIFDIIRSPQM